MLTYLLVAVFLNIYTYRGIRLFTLSVKNNNWKRNIKKYYRLTDVLFVTFSLLWIIIIRTSDSPDYVKYRNYLYITGAFALIYFPRFAFVPFILINDLIKLLHHSTNTLNKKISSFFKKAYKSKIILSIGLIVSILMFLLVIYGIVIEKNSYTINKIELSFDDLPGSFDGLKLVHISDTHFGSFKNKDHIIRGLEKIKGLDPDIIVFTGDLINNEAAEGEPYIEPFVDLEPELGKFSVLGNHDIGDYRRWYKIEDRKPCIKSIEELHKNLGFELLRNHHQFIFKNGDSIMIAGVDNWGLSPFEKIGDLSEALNPYDDFGFIILLSHDPTHWQEEVLSKENIKLTLSGHTHGMQLGINFGNYKWSPAKYVYEHWHGLYNENSQFLYVNSGMGFISLPLRIGMPPEITFITLLKN